MKFGENTGAYIDAAASILGVPGLATAGKIMQARSDKKKDRKHKKKKLKLEERRTVAAENRNKLLRGTSS